MVQKLGGIFAEGTKVWCQRHREWDAKGVDGWGECIPSQLTGVWGSIVCSPSGVWAAEIEFCTIWMPKMSTTFMFSSGSGHAWGAGNWTAGFQIHCSDHSANVWTRSEGLSTKLIYNTFYDFLTCLFKDGVQKAKMNHFAKMESFCNLNQNRSHSCGDIMIFRFFKMATGHHFRFKIPELLSADSVLKTKETKKDLR